VLQKNEATKLLAIIFSNRNRFQNSFTAEKRMKFPTKPQRKNFNNRLRFEKVIAKSLVASFFETQCINNCISSVLCYEYINDTFVFDYA